MTVVYYINEGKGKTSYRTVHSVSERNKTLQIEAIHQLCEVFLKLQEVKPDDI